MHIVILTPGFPKNEEDNLCIPPFQSFLKRIQQTNPEYTFSVITLHYPYNEQHYSWHGIPVYACGGNNCSFPKRLIIWKKATKHFHTIFENQNVSALHSLWVNETALISQYLTTKYKLKHISTFMGQDVLSGNRYLKWVNLKHTNCVFVSENQKNDFFKLKVNPSINTYFIIPWGFDLAEIPFQQKNRTIDILGVGSLTQLKNFEQFIRVISAIIPEFQNLKVKLIGNGPELEKLKNHVATQGLDRFIEFTGLLNRKDVLSYMQESKVFLHTSNYESFGYVFLEALASGMYVISKPVGFAKSHKKWFVSENEHTMTIEIKRLLSMPIDFEPVYLSSIDTTVNSYINLYSSL